jgi:hypothetical protein
MDKAVMKITIIFIIEADQTSKINIHNAGITQESRRKNA